MIIAKVNEEMTYENKLSNENINRYRSFTDNIGILRFSFITYTLFLFDFPKTLLISSDILKCPCLNLFLILIFGNNLIWREYLPAKLGKWIIVLKPLPQHLILELYNYDDLTFEFFPPHSNSVTMELSRYYDSSLIRVNFFYRIKVYINIFLSTSTIELFFKMCSVLFLHFIML